MSDTAVGLLDDMDWEYRQAYIEAATELAAEGMDVDSDGGASCIDTRALEIAHRNGIFEIRDETRAIIAREVEESENRKSYICQRGDR